MDHAKVYVPYYKLWQFYRANMEQCRESYVLMAENLADGCGIYLTEEDGLPILYVFLGENDRPELRAELLGETAAEAIAGKAYRAFLFAGEFEDGPGSELEEPDIEPDDGPHDCCEEAEGDEIYAREDELYFASGDFLAAVLRMFDGEAVKRAYGDDLIEGFLEQALLTIAEDFGLPVYRPMYVDGADGQAKYVEYPYREED